MLEAWREPWPWYVVGPAIGLLVGALQLMGRAFGISSSLRHLCAAALPGRNSFLRYDWRGIGGWNLVFALGIVAGAALAAATAAGPIQVATSDATHASLRAIGVTQQSGLVPELLFGPRALTQPVLLALLIGGGFLVGFGARYAGGCTSGHAITGLSRLQASSLLAVCGFFAGGLFAANLVLPWLLRLALGR